jgi:hypothetical protein
MVTFSTAGAGALSWMGDRESTREFMLYLFQLKRYYKERAKL